MFQVFKNIGNRLTSNKLTVVILIAVLSITFSLYRISQAEKDLAKDIHQLNRESEQYSGISEELFHLDDKLTTSTLLYIYTKDELWKEKYKYNRNRLSNLLSKELRATSDEFILKSLEQLKTLEINVVSIENEAMRHVVRDGQQKAIDLLNEKSYLTTKKEYANILDEIRNYLLKEAEENNIVISEGLKQNRLLYFLILMMNLGTWLLLVTMFDKSRKQVSESNIELKEINATLNRSLSLEKNKAVRDDVEVVMDKYLRFLKANLPFTNYHILEKSGDLYGIKKSIFDNADQSILKRIDKIEDPTLIKFINKTIDDNEIKGLAKNLVIDKVDLVTYSFSLDSLCCVIDSNRLLLIEGENSNLVIDSHISILQTITTQLMISLENADIYQNMEDTIEKRTSQLRNANILLREKEINLTNAQKIAKLGNWISNENEGTLTVSDEVLSILGIENEDRKTFKPEFFAEYVDTKDFYESITNYENFKKGKSSGQFELKVKSANNNFKYLYIRAADKKVVNGNVIVFGTIQDITDRKQIELAYKESRERFLNVFENNQTGVVVTNENHKFTMVNSQFVNMLGYNKKELMEMSIFDIANIEQREKSKINYQKLVEGNIKSFVEQKQYKRKDGNHIHVIVKTFGNYDSENNFIEAVASVLDITQQIESNKKVMESIIETENLERTRIATTLHDSIGQNLTSLHLMLGSISKSETIGIKDLISVEKAIKIAKDTILETRQISHNLMPKYISRFGLLASIDNLVQDLNSTNSGIEFSLYTNFSDEILTVSIQIAIYRIVQEAVNNILKYSKATNVYLQLVKHGNIITVLIDDNGCGFDLNTAKNKESLGLKSIKNRANSISAELEIDTMPDRGTTISLQLTLNNEND